MSTTNIANLYASVDVKEDFLDVWKEDARVDWKDDWQPAPAAANTLVAAFTSNVIAGGTPLTVAFTNESLGVFQESTWNFGDGNSSHATSPTYTFTNMGTHEVTLTIQGSGGYAVSMPMYITVSATGTATTPAPAFVAPSPLAAPPAVTACVAAFTSDVIAGGAPLTVNFTNESLGSYNESVWSFGDGQTSQATSPSHRYTNQGTYTVSLTVSGAGGKSVTTQVGYVKVVASETASTPAPAFVAPAAAGPVVNTVAAFTSDVIAGGTPLTVNFTNMSLGTYSTSKWDFGDTSVSDLQNPTHVYTNEGMHTVTLTVNGPGGESSVTEVYYINVHQSDVASTPAPAFVAPPAAPVGGPVGVVAAFTSDVIAGGTPLTVNFTNESLGTYNESIWHFGDGGVASDTNPSHKYTNEGMYTVSLTVSGAGGTSTVSMPYYVNVGTTGAAVVAAPAFVAPAPAAPVVPPAIVPVVAAFGENIIAGGVPLTVNFANESTGSFTNAVWTMGDGNTLSYYGANAATNPIYTYTNIGTYSVSLTVSGPGGTATASQPFLITVYPTGTAPTFAPVQPPAPPAPPAAPVAAFTYALSEPLSYVFTNASTGTYTNLLWDFGDGSQSTETNPTHVYANAGTYIVNLVASDKSGSQVLTSTTVSQTLNVVQAPIAAFTANVTSGTHPLVVTFSNNSLGTYTSSAWNFGDGGTSTAQNPTYTYTTPGLYTVSLTVSGTAGTNGGARSNYINVS